MTPGQIVLVDKRRPAIVVSAPRFFGSGLPFEIVVPLTGEPALAIAGASTAISPTRENGCRKVSYAPSWAVQTVAHARITATHSRVTEEELARIRETIGACVGA